MWPQATTREVWIGALVILFSFSGRAQSATVPLSEIVSRMQSSERDSRNRATAYTATRQYVLADEDPKTPDSRVSAEINFVPPSKKDYTLNKVQGSDRVARIVRRVLNHETEMATHAERDAITTDNYNFALLGTDTVAGHRCHVLQLMPKREVADLVRGRAWVDADDFRIRRIAGQPAKSPSWWIRDLQVTIDFGEVLGVWTQLTTRATADVRWMGGQIFTSQTTDIRIATVSARNLPRSVSHTDSKAQGHGANSAIWVAR